VLGVAERDDPERILELSPLDKGSGVHDVLEHFLEHVLAVGPPDPDQPWTDADRADVRALAERVFADYEARGRTGRAVHWRITRDELLLLLDDFLTADDRFRATARARPIQVELAFGDGDDDAVSLPLRDGRTMSFRGRADRVDRRDDGTLVVTDYKTGKGDAYKGIDGDPVQGGATLQLGLYAEAAQQLLGAPASEAHYWMVNPGAAFVRYGYPWTDDRRERLIDVVSAIADGIEGGVFAAVPGEFNSWRGTNENCRFCDFDRLCPRDRGEHAEAKVAAPQLRVRERLTWIAAP
jgi:ATP-dependent helicase/nuclease subunit B